MSSWDDPSGVQVESFSLGLGGELAGWHPTARCDAVVGRIALRLRQRVLQVKGLQTPPAKYNIGPAYAYDEHESEIVVSKDPRDTTRC